jgi:glycosyltransferase involved in cell wall biosynthesis
VPQSRSVDPDIRGKSLLIFEDGLRSARGHWFEYDKAVVAAQIAAGCEVTVLCHADFNQAAQLEGLGARVLPVILQSIFADDFAAPSSAIGKLASTVRLGLHFSGILKGVLQERSFDYVLHPSAMIADLLAWRLVPRRLRRRAGRIGLFVRYGLAEHGQDGPPRYARKHRAWRLLLASLNRERGDGRLRLLTDSSRLADEYATVSGVRPHVVCHPQAFAPPRQSTPRDALTFSSLGPARFEKGIDLVQDAIAQLIAGDEAQGLRFVLQWSDRVAMPDGMAIAKSPALRDAKQVEYVEGELASARYEGLLAATDCMILPYRRAFYHSRISGVAVEAACAGIPMIYTADTWLADFVAEQGAGVAVADGDAAGLARAIAAVKADYGEFKRLAVERSAVARARNSPERFVRMLWNGAG